MGGVAFALGEERRRCDGSVAEHRRPGAIRAVVVLRGVLALAGRSVAHIVPVAHRVDAVRHEEAGHHVVAVRGTHGLRLCGRTEEGIGIRRLAGPERFALRRVERALRRVAATAVAVRGKMA